VNKLKNSRFVLLPQKLFNKKNQILLVIYGVLGVFFSLWPHKKLLGIFKPEKKICRKLKDILKLKKAWFMD
jgi:hypothetical protein